MIDKFKGRYKFLCNFYEHYMSYLGFMVNTSEHAFQLAKGINIEDMRFVAHATTAGEAKKRGRQIQLRQDWESVKNDVMREVLLIKFSDSELRKRLLATYPQELIEGNTWNDQYWGVCNGIGENWLGKTLMEIRDEIYTASCT